MTYDDVDSDGDGVVDADVAATSVSADTASFANTLELSGNQISSWSEVDTTVGSDPTFTSVTAQDGTFSNSLTLSGTTINAWSDIDSGTSDGGTSWAVQSVTSAYTASDHDIVLADASSAGFDVTLPAPTAGDLVFVKKTDSTTNPVTLATPNSETIDGETSRSISNQYTSRQVVSDGTNYFIL